MANNVVFNSIRMNMNNPQHVKVNAVRNIWINNYIIYLVLVIILLYVLKRFLSFADKKWSIFNPVRSLTSGLRNTLVYKRIVFTTIGRASCRERVLK